MQRPNEAKERPVPTPDHPLPGALPAISVETARLLIGYGAVQILADDGDAVAAWLDARETALAAKFSTLNPQPSADTLRATAALDLLRWRSRAKDYRGAVDWLLDRHQGFAQAMADWPVAQTERRTLNAELPTLK